MMKKKKILHLLYSFFVIFIILIVLVLYTLLAKKANISSELESLILVCILGVYWIYTVATDRDNSTGFPFKHTQNYYRIYNSEFNGKTVEIKLLKSPNDKYYKIDFIGELQNSRAKNIISMALAEVVYKFRDQRYRDRNYDNECKNLKIYSEKPISLNRVNFNAINYLYFEKIDLSALLLEIDDHYCDDYYKLYESFANSCNKLFLPEIDKRQYAFIADEIKAYIICYPLSFVVGHSCSTKERITFFKHMPDSNSKYIKITEDEYYYIKKIILQKIDHYTLLKYLEENPYKQST